MKNQVDNSNSLWNTITIIVFAVLICGGFLCKKVSEKINQKAEQHTEPYNEQHTEQLSDGFKIWVIDSCEYVYLYKSMNTGYMFSHKGNCKYCAIRNKK